MSKRLALFFGLGIFSVVAQAQQQSGHKASDAATVADFAPQKCGVLVPCGKDKIFMFFCSADKVTVKLCGEDSKYPIDDQNKCVGPDKTLTRTDFISFVKSQISNSSLQTNSHPSQRQMPRR